MAIRRIDKWIYRNWLKIPPEKTEAMIFYSDHRKVNGVSFRNGKVEIAPLRAVKYIDIWRKDVNFGEHVKTK